MGLFVRACVCVIIFPSTLAKHASMQLIILFVVLPRADVSLIQNFLNVANERTSNQKNKQMNKQMPNEQPNAEQTNRKSEGKSVFESFKLWDFTLLKMIIQTKICYLF